MMNVRLVNVRLDDKRLKKAQRLRSQGITLSDLVREAIDERYEKLIESPRQADAEAIIREIHKEYPDPPGLPARDYNVHNRNEARRGILRNLHRKRK
ncbi:MAG TPA: hypothetical protein VGK48_24960 [Terriglobia bacterium]|jgi:hypothetical protein